MKKATLAQFVTLYQAGEKSALDTPDIEQARVLLELSKTDREEFARTLLARSTTTTIRSAVLNCLDLGLNASSLPSIGGPEALLNLLRSFPVLPQVRPVEEGYLNAIFSQRRSQSTNNVSSQQREAVLKECSKVSDLSIHLSTSGSSDIRFSPHSPGADGKITFDGHDIFVYMRWGKNSGGSQNDRRTDTIKTIRTNPDHLFLAIHDGVEVMSSWSKYIDSLKDVRHGRVLTTKMIPYIDWHTFVRRKKTFSEWIEEVEAKVATTA